MFLRGQFRVFRCAILISLFTVLAYSMLAAAVPAKGPADGELPLPDEAPPSATEVFTIEETYPDALPADLACYDRYTVAERKERGLPTELPPSEPYHSDKVVYLTFDDGPDPQNTPAVLDILRQEKIKASFFIVGSEAEKYPDLVRRIYQAGHAIGNHTYSHVYRDIYRSPASYATELHRTDSIIKAILGVRPRIVRAPGGTTGTFTADYWALLRSEGYREIGWNISAGDASASKAPQLVQNIAYQLVKNKFLWNHAIVLMHDGRGHDETVKALTEIIHTFKQQGFSFRVVNLATPAAW